MSHKLLCLIVVSLFPQIIVAQDLEERPREVSSFAQLIEILNTDKINHQPNEAENYTIVPINKNGLQAAQVIRWAAHDGVVHFIQVIPIQIEAERLPAIESAMIRLNHSYPVPGLGMNHENNTPYFRLTVPLLPRGHLLENEVKEYFSFCVNQAVNFTPALLALSKGEVAAKDILQFQRTMIQRKLGPIGVWRRSFGGSDWVMQIKPNGETTLLRDGDIVVDTMAKFMGEQITFEDVTGDLAVDGIGVYTYKVQGTNITFTAVEDDAEGRKQVLSDGPWSR